MEGVAGIGEPEEARRGDAGRDPVTDELYRTTVSRLAEVELSTRTMERDGHLLDACVVPGPARSR